MKYLTEIPLKLKTPDGIESLRAGDIFIPDSEDSIRCLLENSKVRPVKDIVFAEYQGFIKWLGQHDLTIEEIREHSQELCNDLLGAVEGMDVGYYGEDLAMFRESKEKAISLYKEALNLCRGNNG